MSETQNMRRQGQRLGHRSHIGDFFTDRVQVLGLSIHATEFNSAGGSSYQNRANTGHLSKQARTWHEHA